MQSRSDLRSKTSRRVAGTILSLFFVAVGVFALVSAQGLAEPDADFGSGRRRGWAYTQIIALVVEKLGGVGSALLFCAIGVGILLWTYRDLLPRTRGPLQK